MRSIPRLAIAALTLLLLLTATSCPGTDVIKVDTGDVVLTFEMSNQASRYTDEASDFAGFDVIELNIRPHDAANARCSDSRGLCTSDSDCPSGETCFFGDADEVLGKEPIALIRFAAPLDLSQPSLTFDTVPLHSGDYRIVGMKLGRIVFQDISPTIGSPDCFELVVNPGPDAVLGPPGEIDDFNRIPDSRAVQPARVGDILFGDVGNPIITLPPGGGTLTVAIDVNALIAAFEGAFTCVPAPMDICFVGALTYDSYACLTSFNESAFTSAVSSYMTFN